MRGSDQRESMDRPRLPLARCRNVKGCLQTHRFRANAYNPRPPGRRGAMGRTAGVVCSGLAIAAAATLIAVNHASTAAQTNRIGVPQFEPDPLWSEALPNKWVTGQVGGLAVDRHDNLWVFHRPATIPDGEKAASLNPPQAECCIPAPAVLEFNSSGKFLQAWGGPGQGYEWFTSEHGVYVDSKDNV